MGRRWIMVELGEHMSLVHHSANVNKVIDNSRSRAV